MIWILTCIILSYLYLISKVKLSYVFSCVFLVAILGYSYLLVPYQYLFFREVYWMHMRNFLVFLSNLFYRLVSLSY